MDWQLYIVPTIVGCILHELAHIWQSHKETGQPIKTIGLGLPFWPKIQWRMWGTDFFVSIWLFAVVVSQTPLPVDDPSLSIRQRLKIWIAALADSDFLLKSPGERTRVAIVGPLANLLLAIAVPVLLLGSKAFLMILLMFQAITSQTQIPDMLSIPGVAPEAGEVAMAWLIVNLVLGFSNLLPVPPLDGGHILLAALDKFLPVEGARKSRRIFAANMVSLVGLFLVIFVPPAAWLVFK